MQGPRQAGPVTYTGMRYELYTGMRYASCTVYRYTVWSAYRYAVCVMGSPSRFSGIGGTGDPSRPVQGVECEPILTAAVLSIDGAVVAAVPFSDLEGATRSAPGRVLSRGFGFHDLAFPSVVGGGHERRRGKRSGKNRRRGKWRMFYGSRFWGKGYDRQSRNCRRKT